jgi:energy-coupling factor transport system substrate-specific component
MALVGAAFGVIFAFTSNINHTFTSAWGVWGECIICWYMLPQALAALVVRKRGAYFITTGINMLAQAMAGNPAGLVPIIGWWLFGGTAGELAIWALSRYKRWSFPIIFIAVAANLAFNWPVSQYFYGWGSQGAFLNIAGTLAQTVTFGLQSGGIAWLLSRALLRANLVGGFKIARDENRRVVERSAVGSQTRTSELV